MTYLPNDSDLQMMQIDEDSQAARVSRTRAGEWGDHHMTVACGSVGEAWFYAQDTYAAFRAYCDDHDLPHDEDAYGEVCDRARHIVKALEDNEGTPSWASVLR